MLPLRLVLLMLSVSVSSMARDPHSEGVNGTTGMALCCRPAYWNCYEQCPTRRDRTDAGCVATCETKHCVARRGSCATSKATHDDLPQGEPAAAAAESTGAAGATKDAPSPSPSASVHYDGQLVGPGTVHFEAYNLDATNQTLSLNGVIFGRLGLTVKVLKTSPSFVVIPGKPTRFTLEVSPAEFAAWNRQLTNLTIAIGFADESERDRWQYQNLLTQQDLQSARAGEFQIKGAFTPTGGKRK